MNNEIKEILDNMKEWSVEGNLYFEINDEKAKLLYDYITNLQKENEILKEELIHKPDNKITLKTDDGKEMFIIQSERIDMQEELNKTNMQLMKRIEDYKSRNEKAIDVLEELIAEFQLNDYITDFDKKMNKPLNILQGSDK